MIIFIFYSLQNSTENFIESGTYITSLIHVITDIFAVMYLANEVKLAGSRLTYYLFECHWMEQSEKSKKCVLILCEFLKHPQELVILNLYPMNLETFTRVMKLKGSLIEYKFLIIYNFLDFRFSVQYVQYFKINTLNVFVDCS